MQSLFICNVVTHQNQMKSLYDDVCLVLPTLMFTFNGLAQKGLSSHAYLIRKLLKSF